jgi:hypothetical protein
VGSSIRRLVFKKRGVCVLSGCFFLALTQPLCAQFGGSSIEYPFCFGLAAGYTNNTLYRGGADLYEATTKWESGHGLTATFVVQYRFFDWLAAQVELGYTQKNFSYKRKLSQMSEVYEYTTNHFLELPLLVHGSFVIGDTGIRIFACAGGFAGFWFAGYRKGVAPTVSINAQTNSAPAYEFDEWYEFDDRRDNRFEFGLAGGMGVQYDFEVFSIFFDWRFNYGLSDLQKEYYSHYFIPQKNDTWIIRLGVLITGEIFG